MLDHLVSLLYEQGGFTFSQRITENTIKSSFPHKKEEYQQMYFIIKNREVPVH